MAEIVHTESDSDFDLLRKRRGKFKIDARMIERWPHQIIGAMLGVLVVRCEHLFAENRLEYTAFSLGFDPVPEHEESPEYQLIVGPEGRRFERITTRTHTTG